MLNALLQMHLKLLQKEQLKKTAEATGYLIRNKIVDKSTRVSKISQKNNPETNEEEIHRERYIEISPEKNRYISRIKTKNY